MSKSSANSGEPWLDPKYLPPEPDEGTPEQGGPYSAVTPGVLKVQQQGGGANGGGVGGVARGGKGRYQGGGVKLKPASSYFPKS